MRFFPARFRKARFAIMGLLCTMAIAAWTILPVPWLAKPNAAYVVGTATFRWVDDSRSELATDNPDDKCNVIVQEPSIRPQAAQPALTPCI